MTDYESIVKKYKLYYDDIITDLWCINVGTLLAYYFCDLVNDQLPTIDHPDRDFDIPDYCMTQYKKCLEMFSTDYDQRNGDRIFVEYNNVVFYMNKLIGEELLPTNRCPKEIHDIFKLSSENMMKTISKLQEENKEVAVLREINRDLNKKMLIISTLIEK